MYMYEKKNIFLFQLNFHRKLIFCILNFIKIIFPKFTKTNTYQIN